MRINKQTKILFILAILVVGIISVKFFVLDECNITVTAGEKEILEYLGDATNGYTDVEQYRDIETGVHYFIEYGNGGICPRYNADGTLYVD